MRLRWSVPLPGPFSIGGSIGGGRGPGLIGSMFLLPLLMTWWTVKLTWLLLKLTWPVVVAVVHAIVMLHVLLFRGAVAGVRAYRARHGAEYVEPETERLVALPVPPRPSPAPRTAPRLVELAAQPDAATVPISRPGRHARAAAR